MTSPADMIDRLDNLNLHNEITDTIEAIVPTLIKAQRAQMLSSTLSTDEPILPLYSPAYAKKKGFTRPDLFLTGTMQEEIVIDVRETEVYYNTADADKAKVERVEDHYGKDIWTLGTDAREKVQEVAGPQLIDHVTQTLKL